MSYIFNITSSGLIYLAFLFCRVSVKQISVLLLILCPMSSILGRTPPPLPMGAQDILLEEDQENKKLQEQVQRPKEEHSSRNDSKMPEPLMNQSHDIKTPAPSSDDETKGNKNPRDLYQDSFDSDVDLPSAPSTIKNGESGQDLVDQFQWEDGNFDDFRGGVFDDSDDKQSQKQNSQNDIDREKMQKLFSEEDSDLNQKSSPDSSNSLEDDNVTKNEVLDNSQDSVSELDLKQINPYSNSDNMVKDPESSSQEVAPNSLGDSNFSKEQDVDSKEASGSLPKSDAAESPGLKPQDSANGEQNSQGNSKGISDDAAVQHSQANHVNNMPREQLQFVRNEMIMLHLESDDVNLGRVSEKAKLEYMPALEYVQLFWKKFDEYMSHKKRKKIRDYVANYQHNFAKVEPDQLVMMYMRNRDRNSQDIILNKYNVAQLALEAVEYGDYYALTALLENFDILQMRDSYGNNLLARGVLHGHDQLSSWLVYKGVDINARNINRRTPMILAAKAQNYKMMQFLQAAGTRPCFRDVEGNNAMDYITLPKLD